MGFLQSPITQHIASYSLITKALVFRSQTCANTHYILRQGILQDFFANLDPYHIKKACFYSTSVAILLLPSPVIISLSEYYKDTFRSQLINFYSLASL